MRSTSSPTELVHSKLIRGVGIFALVLFGVLAVVSTTVFSNPTTTVITTSVFVGFALSGLYLVLQYARERHLVDDDHLVVGRVVGRKWQLEWSDVEKLERRGMRLELHTEYGRPVRISATMQGIPTFASTALKHLPPDAMDAETRRFLKFVAAGRSPFEFQSRD